MRGVKLKILCLIALLLFCFILNSCKISEDVLQSSAEVDFLTPQNVQISFNDHIYNCVVNYDGSRLQLIFSDEKDLLDGAYASITNDAYKITYKNPNLSLLDRIMNFDYYYCLGVVEQNLEIINNDGEIELVPILDKNGKYNWEVLEDSENEDLTKEIKYFLDNN